LAFTPLEGEELLLITDYKIKRLCFNVRYHFQKHQPFAAIDYFNINILNARISYVLNPAYNLNLCVGIMHRRQNFNTFKTLNSETNYLYIGFRTSIYNLYYDF